MLRRKHYQPVESIDMLRSKGLRKFTPVYSADGASIGSALRFIHRPVEDVNPELKLYRTYLITQSVEYGGPVYVPTMFVEDYDPETNRLTLSVDAWTLAEEVWNREPDFAARGLGVSEELPLA